MQYISSRGLSEKVSSSAAILKGLAPDGGLFLPQEIKPIDLQSLKGKSYTEIALSVLSLFLTDYDTAFLKETVDKVYGENFGSKAGHIEKVTDGLFSLELWHGPTCAFKDYALQLMPHLFVKAREMQKEESTSLILVATSGDTGKAALEGYKNAPGVEIVVFYPDNGTSEIQRLQMATQEGDNVAVYAVVGNFDDTQTGVKKVFHDEKIAQKLLAQGKKLSSANSINWGRLAPQIIYYISTYLDLVAKGEISFGAEIDFCVPTGNFGDILAGYYAKQMGVPIRRLISASNSNNVLADFFESGVYNAKREFYKTTSPSMDILVSSNLERLLYHKSGSGETVKGWMNELSAKGEFTVDTATFASIKKDFDAGWASEDEVDKAIKSIYEKHGYLCDPHTAAAFAVAEKLKKDDTLMVVVSTASPYKFSCAVLGALGLSVPQDEFEALHALNKISGLEIPQSLLSLKEKPVRFGKVISKQDIDNIAMGNCK